MFSFCHFAAICFDISLLADWWLISLPTAASFHNPRQQPQTKLSWRCVYWRKTAYSSGLNSCTTCHNWRCSPWLQADCNSADVDDCNYNETQRSDCSNRQQRATVILAAAAAFIIAATTNVTAFTYLRLHSMCNCCIWANSCCMLLVATDIAVAVCCSAMLL